jgi:thiol-disulfide isomerase/thioredoxin
VAVILALVAVLLSDGAGDDKGSDPVPAGVEQTRPVAVEGDVLPPRAEGDDPAIGSVAPAVDGASFDGTPVTIGDDGRPKVLVFLAHWCPHCQRTVPFLADWFEANGLPDDVDVYGVATSTSSDRPNYPPSTWLTREGWTPPTLADDDSSTAAQAYGLTSFPFFVVIGADGQVVARGSGELGAPQWEALLDAARSGQAG